MHRFTWNENDLSSRRRVNVKDYFGTSVSLGIPCFFNTFVFYCRSVCRALSVGRIVTRINAVS